MLTETQFRADRYIQREIVTDEVTWLGDQLCHRTRRPRTAFGAKGDRAHVRGAHRSQEFLLHSRLCTNRTYTVQTGLTAEQERYIGGVDFNPGSVSDMIAQSRRLLAAMKAGQLDEVREIYCNVDGDKIVDGWDNVRDRAATSDSSHLWHWHLTIDRRQLRNQALMQRILAIALDLTPPTRPPMRETDVFAENLRLAKADDHAAVFVGDGIHRRWVRDEDRLINLRARMKRAGADIGIAVWPRADVEGILGVLTGPDPWAPQAPTADRPAAAGD